MDNLTLIGGIIIGAFLGAVLWDLFVTGPSYRRLLKQHHRMEDRMRTWQDMAIIAWEERDRTHHKLDEIYGDNTRHSIKAVK